jgi:hypothetical protein
MLDSADLNNIDFCACARRLGSPGFIRRSNRVWGLKRSKEMKKIIALLILVILGFSLPSRSQDQTWQHKIHRLEYIHYNPITHLVEWGISEGTVSDSGSFVPSEKGVTTYSINLSTGLMTHDGESDPLAEHDFVDVFRVFRALTDLMQNYTQTWEGVPVPDQNQSSGGDSDEKAQPYGLAMVGQHENDVFSHQAWINSEVERRRAIGGSTRGSSRSALKLGRKRMIPSRTPCEFHPFPTTPSRITESKHLYNRTTGEPSYCDVVPSSSSM